MIPLLLLFAMLIAALLRLVVPVPPGLAEDVTRVLEEVLLRPAFAALVTALLLLVQRAALGRHRDSR
jgi:ABC-type Co2+ transport system permease subunit